MDFGEQIGLSHSLSNFRLVRESPRHILIYVQRKVSCPSSPNVTQTAPPGQASVKNHVPAPPKSISSSERGKACAKKTSCSAPEPGKNLPFFANRNRPS